MQPSASRQMPSGPTPSAQTRRFDRVPSSAMSNAVSRAANDSATMSVLLSGVMTMPFGNAISLGDLADVAVRRDQRDLAGRLSARQHVVEVGEVEVDRVDVDVAAPVDRHLAPAVRRDVAEIGMPDAGAVGLDADQLVAGDRASGRPGASSTAQPRPSGPRSDHLALAVEVDGDDLLGAPVGEPQPAVVPARGLRHRQAIEQHTRLVCVREAVRHQTSIRPVLPRGDRRRRQNSSVRTHIGRTDLRLAPLAWYEGGCLVSRSRGAEGHRGRRGPRQREPRRGRRRDRLGGPVRLVAQGGHRRAGQYVRCRRPWQWSSGQGRLSGPSRERRPRRYDSTSSRRVGCVDTARNRGTSQPCPAGWSAPPSDLEKVSRTVLDMSAGVLPSTIVNA